MSDPTPNYRIWQSPDGLLIQAGTGSIELTVADAFALAAELKARLGRGYIKWSPELIAECARLYTEDGLGERRIAKRLGLSITSVSRALQLAGIARRQSPTATKMRAVLAANRARKRAA